MKKLLLILMLTAPAFSQTWFKVASEPDTVAVASGITWRYGIAAGITPAGVDCSKVSCWSKSSTAALNGTTSDAHSEMLPFAGPDPAPGVGKELDILETAVAQTVTVNGKTVSVPALPPVAYPPIAFTPGTVYTFTVTPLKTTVTVTVGTVSVPLVCGDGQLSVDGSTASFACIPVPIK